MTRAVRRGPRTVSALQIVGLVVILLLAFRVATGPRMVVPRALEAGLSVDFVVDGPVSMETVSTAGDAEQTVEARRIRRVRTLDSGAVLLAGVLIALGLLARQTQARRLAEPTRRVLTVTWRDSLRRRGPPLLAS